MSRQPSAPVVPSVTAKPVTAARPRRVAAAPRRASEPAVLPIHLPFVKAVLTAELREELQIAPAQPWAARVGDRVQAALAAHRRRPDDVRLSALPGVLFSQTVLGGPLYRLVEPRLPAALAEDRLAVVLECCQTASLERGIAPAEAVALQPWLTTAGADAMATTLETIEAVVATHLPRTTPPAEYAMRVVALRRAVAAVIAEALTDPEAIVAADRFGMFRALRRAGHAWVLGLARDAGGDLANLRDRLNRALAAGEPEPWDEQMLRAVLKRVEATSRATHDPVARLRDAYRSVLADSGQALATSTDGTLVAPGTPGAESDATDTADAAVVATRPPRAGARRTRRGATIEEARRALATATPREAAALTQVFGLDGDEPKTLQEVADHEGITRQRVSQLIQAALARATDSSAPETEMTAFEGKAPRPGE